MRRSNTIACLICGVFALSGAPVHAVPILQVYIEGATYDGSTETWYAESSGKLRVWAIGNVAGEGGKGTISDVKMAIAYASGPTTPTISLIPSTTGGYGGYTDPSIAHAATFSQVVTDGSAPLLSNGKAIPSHDVYGPSTSWTEFNLSDFDLTDALAGDFTGSGLPTPVGGYDVNVYEVSISGIDQVHIDLYDSVMADNHVKVVFAPFSHDGAGALVPDGGTTVALLGVALLGIGGVRRFTRRAKA